MVVVRLSWAAGHLFQITSVVITAEGLIATVVGHIVFYGEVSSASIALVTHSEIGDLPGILAPVMLTQLRHRTLVRRIHILHPLRHLVYRATAQIATDVGFGAQLLAHVQELMRAEGIILCGVAPVGVHHLGTILSDTVHPVILIGKTAAWPSQVWYANLLQGVEHVFAHPVDIGDL